MFQPLIDFLLWVPVVTLGAYVPAVCYLDMKYREVDHSRWVLLATINIPVLAFMYLSGEYVPELFFLSMLAVVAWFWLMKLGVFEGADFMFLMMISLFFVVNPISRRVLMPLVLAEFLIAFIAAINIVMLSLQYIDKKFYWGRPMPLGSLRWLVGTNFRMFPMLPIISLAFITAVVLG